MPSTLANLGEFGLIDWIKKIAPTTRDVINGIGDDTAVLKTSVGKYLLLTTDMLIEGSHFTRRMDPQRIGHKALACNISDIAAMGGIPKFAVVSLGVPSTLNGSFVKNIYQGMNRLAKKFNVSIVGGDTNKSPHIVINVALTGEVSRENFVLRKGARPGDKIYVTGPLGGSFQSGKHLLFIPRVKESQLLVKKSKPSSMIDISDGLAADLNHILKHSGVGAILEEENIPCAPGAQLDQALYEGEDFELLFTLSSKKTTKFDCIGEIVARSGIWLKDKKGKLKKISAKGFRHF
ncbi:MAG: thiamine-phosphate kinase [Candidatus Omnitrophica bacterium]|nr:thiamine-phosphate kinase [Candidatus Omnitrophota bacterium]